MQEGKEMRMRIGIFILIVALAVSLKGFCEDINAAQTLFSQGNVHYIKGHFQEAIRAYEAVRRKGFESGQLYYNLGNAYFKTGALGEATLNYLRARRFLPRDPEVRANLAYVRSQEQGPFFHEALPVRLARLFTLNELAGMSSTLYFLFAACLVCMFLLKKKRTLFRWCTGVTGVSLVAAVFFFLVNLHTVHTRRAIVISESVQSRFEPFEEATVFFRLSEGTPVKVLSSEGGWVKVRRGDGKQGWVKRQDVESL
jgi:hypothetical protein